jgi:hypothetical protein
MPDPSSEVARGGNSIGAGIPGGGVARTPLDIIESMCAERA